MNLIVDTELFLLLYPEAILLLLGAKMGMSRF